MSKCSLGVADASGSELIDRPKGGEAVPVRAQRVTGIESRAQAAGEPGCAREHAPAAEAGEVVEDE